MYSLTEAAVAAAVKSVAHNVKVALELPGNVGCCG